MSDISYHRSFISLISSPKDVVFNDSYIELEFVDNLEESFAELGIKTEHIGDRLRLITSSIEATVFGKIEDFLKIRKIDDESNFIIYSEIGIISYINGTTYINFESSQENYLVSNAKSYLEFLGFLKKQEKEIDRTFYFVDSYNKDLRKILFINLSDKGRLDISYDMAIPSMDCNVNYRLGYDRFIECFNDISSSLPKFLKATIIKVVSNFPSETRLKNFFEELNQIVDKSRVNFEVYINELSIDKIKKEYDEVKSKYFAELSDILSKVSQNIIALPIGISALLFAIEKVKEMHNFLILLIFLVFATSIYISMLLNASFKDLLYIHKMFNLDYSILIENNLFKKCPGESDLFNEIKDRVDQRVRFLKIIIESYFWVMNFANMIVILFLLQYLHFQTTTIIMILLVAFLTLTFARNSIIEEKS